MTDLRKFLRVRKKDRTYNLWDKSLKGAFKCCVTRVTLTGLLVLFAVLWDRQNEERCWWCRRRIDDRSKRLRCGR